MRSSKPLESKRSVAAVVLNYNGWRDTVECLTALEAGVRVPDHTLVVDNGSTDGSIEKIATAHPWVEIIPTGDNLGFGRGNNVGIEAALARRCDLVWILNNDTKPDPRALGALIEAAAQPLVGVVGSMVFEDSDPRRLEAWGGGKVRTWTATTRPLLRAGEPLDYIAGTSMLVESAVFDQIGFFSDDYFLYMEDVDFSLRARRGGWELAVAEASHIVHKGGASANEGATKRSTSADLHHAYSSGVFLGRYGGSAWVLGALVRATGMVGRRLGRGEPARIVPALRSFTNGLRCGRRSTASLA
jgi:GT2 family glycosyltransferase